MESIRFGQFQINRREIGARRLADLADGCVQDAFHRRRTANAGRDLTDQLLAGGAALSLVKEPQVFGGLGHALGNGLDQGDFFGGPLARSLIVVDTRTPMTLPRKEMGVTIVE